MYFGLPSVHHPASLSCEAVLRVITFLHVLTRPHQLSAHRLTPLFPTNPLLTSSAPFSSLLIVLSAPVLRMIMSTRLWLRPHAQLPAIHRRPYTTDQPSSRHAQWYSNTLPAMIPIFLLGSAIYLVCCCLFAPPISSILISATGPRTDPAQACT